MNLRKKFSEYTQNWIEELNKDEWFFDKFSKSLLTELSPEAAFDLIPEAVDLVLSQDNKHLCLEAFEVLFSLIRKANTTEINPTLDSFWDRLIAHVSFFGEYHKKRVDELRRWYRK